MSVFQSNKMSFLMLKLMVSRLSNKREITANRWFRLNTTRVKMACCGVKGMYI